jgi:hypothetical protein
MNQKKAKGLKKLARQFIVANGKSLSEVGFWYKRMKSSYKAAKGQI